MTTRTLSGFLRQEVAGLAGAAWRWFWRTAALAAAAGVALNLHANLRHPVEPPEPLGTQLLVGLAVGLFYGVPLAAWAALFGGLWRLFGPALLAALALAPLLALGVLALASVPLTASGLYFLDTAIAAADATGLPHTAQAAQGLRMGCGSGAVAALFLAFLAPFLVADLVLLLVQPAVLLALAQLALLVGLALLAAALAALLVTSPLLLAALLLRGRARWAALPPAP